MLHNYRISIPMLALLVVAAVCVTAQAAPLAVTCQSPASDGVQVNSYPAGCNALTLRTPLPTDLVRVDSTKAVGGYADWTSATYKWKTWSKLVAGEPYEACKSTDVPEGTTVMTKCIDWGFVAKVAVVAVPANAVQVSWAAPTTYTDGSPITEAIKYNVYRGSTASALTLLKVDAVSPYSDTGLAPGTYFYSVTALTPLWGESAQGAGQSATVTPPNLKPGPPKSITVTLTVTVP